MFLDLPGATTEQYDRLNEAMRATRPEDEPDGLIHHVWASTGDGLLVADVWRSREELDDFLSNKLARQLLRLDCHRRSRRSRPSIARSRRASRGIFRFLGVLHGHCPGQG